MSKVINIRLELLEDVTPEIFLQRVAMGLARSGALRTGERVTCGETTWEVRDPIEFDLFGSNRRPINMPYIALVE